MARTPYPKDGRLWALLVDEFRKAGAGDDAESRARRAVALVRNEREQEGIVSWGPGDSIPAGVVWVYDLDGYVWTRPSGGVWSMSGEFDPEEVRGTDESLADVDLLDRWGPVTGPLTSPGSGL